MPLAQGGVGVECSAALSTPGAGTVLGHGSAGAMIREPHGSGVRALIPRDIAWSSTCSSTCRATPLQQSAEDSVRDLQHTCRGEMCGCSSRRCDKQSHIFHQCVPLSTANSLPNQQACRCAASCAGSTPSCAWVYATCSLMLKLRVLHVHMHAVECSAPEAHGRPGNWLMLQFLFQITITAKLRAVQRSTSLGSACGAHATERAGRALREAGHEGRRTERLRADGINTRWRRRCAAVQKRPGRALARSYVTCGHPARALPAS